MTGRRRGHWRERPPIADAREWSSARRASAARFRGGERKIPGASAAPDGMIAKQDLCAGADVFEADLALVADQPMRDATHIPRGLVRETGEGRPRAIRFDDSAQAPVDEQRIIDRAGGCRKFPNGYAETRAKVHLVAHPASASWLSIVHSCAIFGVENVLPRGPGTDVRRVPLFTQPPRTISAM